VGGNSSSQTIGYRYSMSILMGLSRGPLDEIVQMDAGNIRAWPIPDGDSEVVDGLMVIAKGPGGVGIAQYENGTYATVSAGSINTVLATGDSAIYAPELFGGDKREGGITGGLHIMMGLATQIVPDYIKTFMGGRVPDFRGVATIFFNGRLCSMNPYPKKWEWRVRRTESGWDGTVWQPSLVTIWMRGGTIKAMNPAHIIYECLTNRAWGRGMPREAIQEAKWLESAETLHAEGFGLCMRYNRQSELGDFIQTIVDHIGGTIYPDRTTGQLALSLLRQDYDVENLPLFTYTTGLIRLEDVETASQEDVVNEIIVKWTDPIGKSERSSRVQNLASRQTMGATNSSTISYAGVPDVDLSLRLCQRDLKASANALKRFRVHLDRGGWQIVPGDVFRISVPERGIYNAVLRAGKVTEAGGSDGRITIDAVLDVFGLASASFITPQESEWVPPSRKAMIADRRLVREATYAELVVTIDPANLALVSSDVGAVATIAGKPTSLSQGYALEVLPTGAPSPIAGSGAFAPYVIASAAIPREPGPTTLSFSGGMDADLMVVGLALQIGSEICRIDAINLTLGTMTIGRGCVDTIPLAHASGTTIFAITQAVGGDSKEYASGEVLAVKVLPFTSSNRLASAIAPTDSLTISGRQGRPYAPGNVRANGVPFTTRTLVTTEITLTWAHRDRILQQDQLISHQEASVGPEAATTYTVRVYDGDTLSPVRTAGGIAGTSYVYDAAMKIADGIGDDVWFEVESERLTLKSFSKYRFPVTFDLVGYGLIGYGDGYGS
jgi:hypothetical protein